MLPLRSTPLRSLAMSDAAWNSRSITLSSPLFDLLATAAAADDHHRDYSVQREATAWPSRLASTDTTPCGRTTCARTKRSGEGQHIAMTTVWLDKQQMLAHLRALRYRHGEVTQICTERWARFEQPLDIAVHSNPISSFP